MGQTRAILLVVPEGATAAEADRYAAAAARITGLRPDVIGWPPDPVAVNRMSKG